MLEASTSSGWEWHGEGRCRRGQVEALTATVTEPGVSLVAQMIKNRPALREKPVRSLGREDPLQYSCLENPMDRGAWQAVVRRVTESDTPEQLTDTDTHTHSPDLFHY